MTIDGDKVIYNCQLSASSISYLRKRMNSLALQLRRRLGNNYNVQLTFSKKSEAGYICISPVFDIVDELNGYRDLTISIRNHKGNRKDYIGLLLCDFKTWNDLKKFVIRDCVPYIKCFDREGLQKEFNKYVLSEYDNKINEEA